MMRSDLNSAKQLTFCFNRDSSSTQMSTFRHVATPGCFSITSLVDNNNECLYLEKKLLKIDMFGFHTQRRSCINRTNINELNWCPSILKYVSFIPTTCEVSTMFDDTKEIIRMGKFVYRRRTHKAVTKRTPTIYKIPHG